MISMARIEIPEYKIKEPLGEVTIAKIRVGGDSSVSFMEEQNNRSKAAIAIEIPFFQNKNQNKIVKKAWGEDLKDFNTLFQKAEKTEADIICIEMNFDDQTIEKELEKGIETIKSLLQKTKKPLIIKGSGTKDIDNIVLPVFAKELKKEVIIAYAEDDNYETLIPRVIENNHILVLRSPIDINLAKELSILSVEMGLKKDRILIDSEMGALGYGFDYAYSMIEKIREAAFSGDKMLSMPIITFVGDETFKTKETKTDNFPKSWGKIEERAVMWELTTATAMISAGANIVVLSHPDSIKILKETLWN